MDTVLFACIHHATRMDWQLEDPKRKPVERVREIRDHVKTRVSALLEAEHWR
ncbi:MAG TPA: hypothetical protein VJV79_14175 [Polyangiaceae bacterium]|nr:hypothetical protein [Polyangiaceae bacterium]